MKRSSAEGAQSRNPCEDTRTTNARIAQKIFVYKLEKTNYPQEPGRCGSEASEDDQADNVSNEALYVIWLHGSGDKISRDLQDWEVAKVALSCHEALDMLRQELYEVERRRVWLGF